MAKKTLNEILTNYTNPIKTVPTLSAQTTTRCETVDGTESQVEALWNKVEKLRGTVPQLFYLCVIMIEGNLRVSEALRIKPKDITSLGKVKIEALKGSHSRLISSGEAKKWLLQCKKINRIPFEGWSRFFVYREFKKLGISFQSNQSTKNSVTHAIRHIVTAANRKVTDEPGIIQRDLGHKNQNTQKLYGKQKRK
jgi:integrase